MRAECPMHQRLRPLRTLTVTLDAIPHLPLHPPRPPPSACVQMLPEPKLFRIQTIFFLGLPCHGRIQLHSTIWKTIRMIHSDI